MKIEAPRFELTRVYSDGTEEAPEIVPVCEMPWDTRMERRGFLGVGIGVAAVLLLVDGKAMGARQEAASGKSTDAPIKVPDKVLNAHKSGVNELVIRPDGKTLVTSSSDKTAKLWSLPDGKLLSAVDSEYTTGSALSSDGTSIAVANWEGVKLWSLPEKKLLTAFKGSEDDSFAMLAMSPDGKTIATSDWDGVIKLRSLPGGKLLAALRSRGEGLLKLVFGPDGKMLASGDTNGTVRLWPLPLPPRRRLPVTLRAHGDPIRGLAISPDGKTLASGADEGVVKLWSLPGGKLAGTLKGHGKAVQSLAFSPDGQTLVSGSADYTVKLWSLPETKLLATLEGHKGSVQALALSPDGKTLSSGDDDGVVILWDVEKRSFITFLFDPKASQTDAISYNVYDKLTGTTLTFTLPCGSPIPPGAVCTCNCVPGTYRPPSPSYSPSSGGGTYCICNQVCTCIPVPSDRNVKESFETPDPLLILERLARLSIQTWNYKWHDASIRHIGPMAQDFAEAFAVGEDDKHISPVDAQGVAFAAIQGLYRMMKERESQAQNLRAKLQRQQGENRELRARVEALERILSAPARGESEDDV